MEGLECDGFCNVIKNRPQFFLAIDFPAAQVRFRQMSHVLPHTKERSGLASIGMCIDVTISKYARYSCAVNLQKMYELLAKAWTFSVARERSTQMNTFYHDIRTHLEPVKLDIINFYVLAILAYEWHTGQVLFDTATRALDVLSPSWQNIIIGVSTDGEKKKISSISGAATLIRTSSSLASFAFGVVLIDLTLPSRMHIVNWPTRNCIRSSPH